MDVHILWLSNHIANSVEPHTHDFYQIIFCKKRGGQISIDGEDYDAKSNFVYFIKPGSVHSIDCGIDMHIIEIKFFAYGDDLNKYLAEVPDEFQLSDISFMKMLFLHIAREGVESKIYCNETINSALKLFLAKAIREFNEISNLEPLNYQIFTDVPNHEKTNTDIMILDLKTYIEQNLDRNITLDELSKKVNLNKTYFVKRFKIMWGISPMKFINNMRIEKAKQLIIKGNLSIQQIADSIGFNSIHYFSRAFKQSEGVAPTEYYKYFNKQ